jgi:hypothetical protein
MARYQIRTPENMELEDVVEQMATCAWGVLKAWDAFLPDRASEDASKRFREAIRLTLDPCVKTYKLCGLSNICVDEVKSTPWSQESHVLDASPQDLVYHLYPGANPDGFLSRLSSGSFEAIESIIKPEFKEQTLSSLRVVFREVLGLYLYYNPVCGKTELCVLSVSVPTEPWEREKK